MEINVESDIDDYLNKENEDLPGNEDINIYFNLNFYISDKIFIFITF